MRWVQKSGVELFRLSFSTGSSSRKTQSKKVESKKPFFDCVLVRKLNLGFSRKRSKKPFSTDKFDCVRNGLTAKFVDAVAHCCSLRTAFIRYVQNKRARTYADKLFVVDFVYRHFSC